MGASASLLTATAQREVGDTMIQSSVSHNTGSQMFLTREVLQRHHISTNRFSEQDVARKRSFSRNSKFTVDKRNEMPLNIQLFLRKIGIDDSSGSVTALDSISRAEHNEQKSKLVTHIFDSLAALEYLVQLDAEFEEEGVGETQSVCDRNASTVGKLVHELVSIYGLCGDSLKILLDTQPGAAAIEDAQGRLPLHVAVDKNRPWIRPIQTLINAYPAACKERDGGGRLPLHIAVDRQTPCIHVVRLLLDQYPEAASTRRGVGRLPIHYSVFYNSPSLPVVEALLEAYPAGAAMGDVYGRLPLHYAVDRPEPSMEVVACLLRSYPAGIAVRDTYLRLPLTIAVEHEGASFAVIKALVDLNPSSVQERGPQGRLPLHSALSLESPSLEVVRFLSQLYPAAITMETKENKRDSPLIVSTLRGLHSITRELLLSRPQEDPELLCDLNWRERKIAFLAALHCSQESAGKINDVRGYANIFSALYYINKDMFVEAVSFV